jgi:hypothetical protein
MQHRSKTQKRAQTGFVRETNSILATVQADNRIFKRRVVAVGTVTTNVAGQITTFFAMDPSAAGDWASLAILYDEFRVVGCRLRMVSRTQNTVTLNSNMVMIVFDNYNTTALASYTDASEFQNVHVIPALFNNAWTYDFRFSRPSAGKETSLPWNDISVSSASPGAVKMYADGLSISTNYFSYVFEWAVEFRGVR